MKILLFGKNGQVGWELSRSLQPLGELIALSREEADFSNPESLRKIVSDVHPNVIVNAVAYTAVDKAESEEELAIRINGHATGVLAEEALKLNALLVHYSTDYVFDGTKHSPYVETDKPTPINSYGRSKLIGEEAITQSGCKYLIFRTSWVYACRGHNFVRTILRLAKERDEIKVVADQVGAPTSAELIADITSLCIYRIIQDDDFGEQVLGTYHLSSNGKTSWHGFAEYLVTEAHRSGAILHTMQDKVFPVTSAEFSYVANRPANSQLSNEKLCNAFELSIPDWQVHVKRTVLELLKVELEADGYKK